jgi:hypothetical protein
MEFIGFYFLAEGAFLLLEHGPHILRFIELYVTALRRSALTPMPLSREARGASSETGVSSGFVILSSSIRRPLKYVFWAQCLQ